jgi:hypothetical protein
MAVSDSSVIERPLFHMKKTTLSASVLGLLLSMMGTTAYATDWHVLPTSRLYSGHPVTAAQAVLADHAAVLGLSGLEFSPYEQLNLDSIRTVRFEQRYHGVPVIDSTVAVRIASDGSVRVVSADVSKNLTVSPVADVDLMLAQKKVREFVGHELAFGGAQLGVEPNEDGGSLIWQVDAAFRDGMRRFMVDAHSGKILRHFSLAKDVKARVYPINPVKGAVQDLDVFNITPSSPQLLNAYDGSVSIYQFVSGDVESDPSSVKLDQSLQPNSGTDYLYDPPASATDGEDSFAQVNIFYHLGRMRSYFETHVGLDMTASKWSLMGVANYMPGGAPYDNAFFTPWQIAGDKQNAIFIGQASAVDYAIDSDVFLHEYTHYVNHNALKFTTQTFGDQFGAVFMPGGIDEGSADYFSCSVNDDAIVGEATLGQYARDLGDTSHMCPDDLIGESHEDGKLIGSTAWAVRQSLGQTSGDKVVWGAMSLLPPRASFGDFGSGLIQTAKDLSIDAAKQAEIAKIVSAEGLNDCGRVLDLNAKQSRRTNLIGLDYFAMMMGGNGCSDLSGYSINLSSIFQFKHTPAATDTSVEFDVKQSAYGSGDLSWNIYVRQGSEVGFGTDSNGFPAIKTFTYSAKKLTSASGKIVIDANSNPPFDPTTPYYLSITYDSCPMTAVEVSSVAGAAAVDAGTDAKADAPADAHADVQVDGHTDAQVDGHTDAQVDGHADAQVDAQADVTESADSGAQADGSSVPAAASDDSSGGCNCAVPTSRTSALSFGWVASLLVLALRRRKN